jgi:predicted AAA+ superfamily ATPase
MERKISNTLLTWKNSKNRRPLILYGARQVGKTYSILSFGKKHYRNTAYFNMEGDTILQRIFERDLDPVRIIRELSAKINQSIFKDDTLIFFDEIQSCEKALTSLKYFCENTPEYHIVAAGSLLGVSINRKNYSFPVGKVDMETLYPMDFEEFLWAIQNKEMPMHIREAYKNNTEFSLHEIALDYYKKYLVIGGMPAAVSEYIEKKDYNFVTAIQKNILNAYVADMAKYTTPHETTKIMASFTSIPAQLAKENKKFQYKVIKRGARAYEYETPLEWLKASGVITKCIKVNEGKLPLSVFADNSAFKVYMTDVGLLCQQFGIPVNTILFDNNGYENFKGALTENYVAGSLVTLEHIPYYWESGGKAEVDFVLQDKKGLIIPIEVKSSNNVRSRSLNEFVKRYKPPYSIRISTKNFGFENNIKSVPLYAVFCIE